MNRRTFLGSAGAVAGSVLLPYPVRSAANLDASNIQQVDALPADYKITISVCPVELAPERIISTTTYNGQFPGPLLRFKEGQQVTMDIVNNTDTPEQLHWHGQMVPVDVDGSAEEGTPFIPDHGRRRITFTPRPAGFRFYHTHVRAGANLSAGQYTGLLGPVYIEPKQEPGRYDREVFLVLKEFEPTLSRGGDMPQNFLAPGTHVKELEENGEAAMKASLASGKPHGYEVGYGSFTINGKMLGHGEPVRVKTGERVLFHILNGSATEIRSLALPGHTFRVLAWIAPPPFHWNYTRFGKTGGMRDPEETIEMVFRKDNAADAGFNRWTINGYAYPNTQMMAAPMWHVKEGSRYRLRMRNASDDIHPIHLHRHSFEVTKVGGVPTGGVLKDVVMVGGYQEVEVEFVADNPGSTLFHCHQQLHMDFGFMALVDYA